MNWFWVVKIQSFKLLQKSVKKQIIFQIYDSLQHLFQII